MAVQPQTPSCPLAESLRYYIVQEPGNTMIPVVPVDQLPYQLQGIPAKLSPRQVSEGNWKFLNETSEAREVLIAHLPQSAPNKPASHPLSSSTYTRFRAPDHDVMIRSIPGSQNMHPRTTDLDNAATHMYQEANPTTTVQHDHGAAGPDLRADHLTRGTRSPISDEHKAPDGVYRSHPQSFPQYATGPLFSYQTVDNQVTDTNLSYADAVATKVSRNDLNIDNVEHEIIPTHRGSPVHPISYDTETVYTPKAPENVTNPITRLSEQEKDGLKKKRKVYCNHWIQHGECNWGDRCLYKHEMPSLDILKQVTGFNRIPRWWKEKQAIQSTGPTWMELRLQHQANKESSDEAEMPTLRQFPDPSMLKSLKQTSDGAIKRDVAEHAVRLDGSTARRHSQSSSSSRTTGDMPPFEQKNAQQRTARPLPAQPPKRTGLMTSKYAPTDEQIKVISSRNAKYGAQPKAHHNMDGINGKGKGLHGSMPAILI